MGDWIFDDLSESYLLARLARLSAEPTAGIWSDHRAAVKAAFLSPIEVAQRFICHVPLCLNMSQMPDHPTPYNWNAAAILQSLFIANDPLRPLESAETVAM